MRERGRPRRRLDHAADQGHEPGLHRQGRLLHRHQAGPAGGRDGGAGRRAAGHAGLAGGRRYPAASLDKAWRLLVFGAHHDAITGTEGDQVYLDLLAGWREALAARRRGPRRAPPATWPGWPTRRPAPAPAADLAIVVFNTHVGRRPAWPRITLASPGRGTGWISLARLHDGADGAVPGRGGGQARRREPGRADGHLPGPRAYPASATAPTWPARPPRTPGGPAAGWMPRAGGQVIENEAFRGRGRPGRGGTLSQHLDKRSGRELLPGPATSWCSSRSTPGTRAGARARGCCARTARAPARPAGPAQVRAERCPVGTRLVAELDLGGLRVTQETLLWDGAEPGRVPHPRGRLDRAGPAAAGVVPGRRAGRPAGLPDRGVGDRAAAGAADTDVAEHEFTLDNPAHEWFGVGSTARVR